MEILFATGNTHKCQEAQEILGSNVSIIMPSDLGFYGEIPETGKTLDENAFQKAHFIWERFHRPCFADDTGLEVDALNGAPGVYSARYAGEPSNAQNNLHKLLKDMDGKAERTARFRCVICYISDGNPLYFEGVVNGRLLTKAMGSGGFGYDPIFVPDGFTETFSELSAAQKNHISHRGNALAKLAKYLI